MKFDLQKIVLKDGTSAIIREVEVEDAEQCLRLIQSSVDTSEYLLLDEANFTIDQEREWISSYKNNSHNILFVVEIGGQLVADMEIKLGTFRKTEHIGSIGITVLKEWRNLGLGSALFQTVLNWIEAYPRIESLELEVFGDNKQAIALYQKYGFVIEGRIKNYFKQPDGTYQDRLIMRLNLK